MKRLFCLFIILSVLVMCTNANATSEQDFQFVGGLHFGMSVDEVERALKENGIYYTIYDLNNDETAVATVKKVESFGIETRWYIWMESFLVGGYEADGHLYFRNDVLTDVDYSFFHEEDANVSNKIYTAIEKELMSKYGQTEYSSETGKRMNLKFSLRPEFYSVVTDAMIRESEYFYNILNYSERKIICDGENDVVVQHHNYTEKLVATYNTGKILALNEKYHTKVSYSLYPKEISQDDASWGF